MIESITNEVSDMPTVRKCKYLQLPTAIRISIDRCHLVSRQMRILLIVSVPGFEFVPLIDDAGVYHFDGFRWLVVYVVTNTKKLLM